MNIKYKSRNLVIQDLIFDRYTSSIKIIASDSFITSARSIKLLIARSTIPIGFHSISYVRDETNVNIPTPHLVAIDTNQLSKYKKVNKNMLFKQIQRKKKIFDYG